ncbi:ThuA domain-containing protein [Paludisphaera mucosa]|uniref:ThuA domain-containing protein n=1 Tax=Paludisphaera mucosa TaxID=3030827 RepID=A0ABT6FF66_9BACT|nr:ThuA domain-containing protein [Paludisphaera mucosa]MDG3006211.1 ThuA domain-containing protein [Paludisphaera mucosa]
MNVDRRSFLPRLVLVAPFVAAFVGASASAQTSPPVRVRIWCEGETSTSAYPEGVDAALADGLSRRPDLQVTRGRLGDPHAGLRDGDLDATDVLVWWGRARHDEVPDERAQAVATRVREGRMGLVALYASCGSKPFRLLMNSMPCEPGSWREDGRPEFVAVKAPEHPIAAGVVPFTILKSDMFSEPFAVPEPETIVFVSNWERGESVRSGLTWSVGKGRVVYLRTGPESFPVLFHPSVRRSIANAVVWGARRS